MVIGPPNGVSKNVVFMSTYACEVCSGDSDRWLTVQGYVFYRCVRCSYIFVPLNATTDHVQSVYDDRYFTHGGAGYPDYVADGPLLREHAARYAALVSRYAKPGMLLDVGAAAGFLLREFIDRGWSGSGLEPNASMAAYAASHLGVQVKAGTLEDSEFEQTQNVDLVTMIQVIMHLYDVRRGLESAARCIKPGGLLLIETPNAASLSARLLGKYWQEYSPPSVLRIFTPDNLRQLVGDYGFVPVASGRPRKVVSGAHARSFLRYKAEEWKGFPHRMLTFISQSIPPGLRIRYHAEDLFWALYRKQE